MSRERTPDPNAAWESFLQQHNERVIPDDAPTPTASRSARRAARKRKNCAICNELLLNTGIPMTRGRWRCDVEAPCRARRARKDAQAL